MYILDENACVASVCFSAEDGAVFAMELLELD
jgi:hypothetical protein